MTVDQIIRGRVRQYAESKRGPDGLRFQTNGTALRIVAEGRGGHVARNLSAGEIEHLSLDEARARVCELIDIVLHELRDEGRK